MASAESFLAVRMFKAGGAGETNVPIRGVQQRSFDLVSDAWRIIEGRRFDQGTDQIIVGKKTRRPYRELPNRTDLES